MNHLQFSRARQKFGSSLVGALSRFLIITLVVCGSLAFFPAGEAVARNGVSVSITSGPLFVDDVNGLDHKVGHGSAYTYTVQIESEAKVTGATLGFRLYSPDGSLSAITWNSIPTNIGLWGDDATWDLTGSQIANGSDRFDGSLPSAWITGGVSLGTVGYGPIESTAAMKFTITFPSVSDGILCFDSAFVAPAGEWLMSAVGVGAFATEWAGGAGDLSVGGTRDHAFCVTTFEFPNSPLICLATPDNLTVSHCDVLEYQANINDPDPGENNVVYSVTTSGVGAVAVDTLGNVTYVPATNEVGEVVIIVNAASSDGQTLACATSVMVTNIYPVITCPAEVFVDKGKSVTSDPVAGSDADGCDELIYSLASVSPTALGTVTVDPSTGAVTFATDSADTQAGIATDYDICISVTDGINSAECCMVFRVLPTEEFCIRIDQSQRNPTEVTFPGELVEICLNYDAGSREIGGFDFMISYDMEVLSFEGATAGNIFPDYEWEYFTYQFGPGDACCPSGNVRIVGLANQNDGAPIPNNLLLVAGDQFACLSFRVSIDSSIECTFSPIRWSWLDCGDNLIASAAGDTLYGSKKVFDYIGTDFSNVNSGFRADLTDGDQPFPTLTGAPDTCTLGSERVAPVRFINYKNGGVRTACLENIDNRGDINLNGISNEVADAVLYKNYFIKGEEAFNSSVILQTLASEVNCDGIPLTVADLVFIQGIILGRILPVADCTGATPVKDTVIVTNNENVISSNKPLGAVLFVFQGGGGAIGLMAGNMQMRIGLVKGNTHVLVSSPITPFEFINPGPILRATGVLLSVDASDTMGVKLEVQFDFVTGIEPNENSALPQSFALGQNYPNPFNPTTTIRADFPRRSEYTLSFYNVQGQKVDEHHAVQGAGTLKYVWEPRGLPTGIYFYKLQAGDFVATKKLLLLK